MKTSRDALLSAGEEIVCREGFGGFSYGSLANAVGVRKASLHHHFPTKAEFGLALVERHRDRLEGDRAAAEFDPRRGSAAMRAWLRERREHLGDGARLDLLTAFALETPALPGALQAALDRARATLLARIRAILLAGRRDRSIAVPGDIESEAQTILALVEGGEIAARAAGDAAAFDRVLAGLDARMTAH
jgi:TetR/AcrR family transcriptional repressor of nem operon